MTNAPFGHMGVGPLENITVIALEQAVAMPFCSFILAELGADVIKIERPGRGDVVRGWDHVARGLSSGFVAFNVGKRDIAIDLESEEGRRIVRELALGADVFLENFAPGVAARLGLADADLRPSNPGLVYCSLSGYGQTGPYRDVKAYDLLIQGESGILLSNGYPEAPAKVGLPITDLVGGSTAAIGVISALYERERTAQGAYLDIAMLDSVMPWLGYFPHHLWHQGAEPPRTGMRHQYLSPYGPYLAADGVYVNLAVANDRDWEKLCDYVLDRSDLAQDERFATIDARREHREELETLLENIVVMQSSETWLEKLAQASLPFGHVRTMAEVLEHPQLIDRQVFVEALSPVGELPVARFPLAAPRRERRVPALGGDTDEILACLGYDSDEIAALRAAKVVA
jgi:itaconate CoA-transferase